MVGVGGATQSTGSSVTNRVSTTWEEGGYLKVKCGAFYTNSSSSSVTWGTSVYTITNGRHAAMAANSSANYIVWEQPNSSSSSDIKFMEYTVESTGRDYTVQVVNQTTPSSGSGFTKNYNPSIIAVSGGARMCWIGYRGTIEEQSATETQWMTAIGGSEQRVVFRDVYYNHFWQFGSNVGSPTITKSDDNTSYYIMWSENDGQYNKFADNSLSTIRTINTTGADVQVTNAHDKNSMFAIAFQTAPVPYRFVKTNTLGSYYGMAKSGGEIVHTGREGIVSFGNGSTFFAFGDVTVDNQPISFVDIADTISVSSVKELNEYLQTKPFRLTKKSDFRYSVVYGVLDTSLLKNAFKEREQINYTVELIDYSTGNILGVFDEVRYSKVNYREHDNIPWQVEADELAKETDAVLRLKIETNAAAKISFAEKYADKSATGTVLEKTEQRKMKLKKDIPSTEYYLGTNYPNPFNPETVIKYRLPENGYVTLKVYDILGRNIATLVNEFVEAGEHEATFNASCLASGMYIYELQTRKFRLVQKMLLTK